MLKFSLCFVLLLSTITNVEAGQRRQRSFSSSYSSSCQNGQCNVNRSTSTVKSNPVVQAPGTVESPCANGQCPVKLKSMSKSVSR